MIRQLVDEQRQVFAMFTTAFDLNLGLHQRITTAFAPEVINVDGDFDLTTSDNLRNCATLFKPDINVGVDFRFDNLNRGPKESETVKSRAHELLLQTNSNSLSLARQLATMQRDAEDAYKQILSLLNLKQMASSLAEARVYD
ncbi:hypothetical protein N7490_010501 [Penicillium lividum]|nr:hypothetical protein N7490_010501 [Penicillium lividum]